jgi:hypothetical protein
MIREAFANANPWGVLAMLGFVALFGLIVWYVASDPRKRHLSKMENLPLEDDRHG